MKDRGGERKPVASSGEPFAVLNCPSHEPFLTTLAASILNGSIWNVGAPESHDLPALTIYLPAHATVEPLKLAFLSLAPNGATFLPRVRVLGETAPIDLFANFGTRMASTEAALRLFEKALAIPPAFDEMERQIQLSTFVLSASQTLQSKRLASGEPLFASVPAVSAFSIAGQIATLIDEAHTEAADLGRIEKLDSANASGSEQLSLQLLRAVWKSWQAHKAKTGKIDREERRNRLMAVEGEFIRQSESPVLIAGSTGSVTATMGLMVAAMARPNSAVVLHGLDKGLDDDSWNVVGNHPEHPQHGLHALLIRLGLDRGQVRDLSLKKERCKDAAPGTAEERRRRSKFLSEALRPASTTAKWGRFIQTVKHEHDSSVCGLSLIEADTPREEAAAIALILRASLETADQTAALVTPDEKLLSRVRHALAQWSIGKDVTAPVSIADRLAARAVACAASSIPEEVLTLLRLSPSAGIRRHAEIIDLGVLRQMWRPSSLEGIPAALSRAQHAVSAGEARHPAMKRIASAEWDAARAFAISLLQALAPLCSTRERRLPFSQWVSAHTEALSDLARLGLSDTTPSDPERSVIAKMAKIPSPSLSFDLSDYAAFFGEIIHTRIVERPEHPHPRIFLLRPLDARLLTADVVVLGGLNEGCWPQTPAPDPWLNRRDRAFIGLSAQERRVGQAAQDFTALASEAPRLYLTRSRKVNGSLARPSRWISRVKAVAAGAGISESLQPADCWLAWARAYGAPRTVTPVTRPEPRPPLIARPRRLSVTAIETWFANPYAIYARHILRLEPLRRLDETSDARDKGILYHAALHGFFQVHPAALPQNAAAELVKELDKAAEALGFNLENAPFWRPRFARFAAWFAETDVSLRADLQVLKSEVGGKLRIDAPAGPFEITARADRIDRLRDGSVRIYDFKTSANTARVSAARGAPQLALEGLLVREGAFAGIAAGSTAGLYYIVATGGEPPGEIVTPKMPCAEAIQAAQTGVFHRIARFDDPATPYAYEARPIYREKAENDPYAHLARVREWSLDPGDDEAGND